MVLECAGRAKRRRRFGFLAVKDLSTAIQSGVALRFATALHKIARRKHRRLLQNDLTKHAFHDLQTFVQFGVRDDQRHQRANDIAEGACGNRKQTLL